MLQVALNMKSPSGLNFSICALFNEWSNKKKTQLQLHLSIEFGLSPYVQLFLDLSLLCAPSLIRFLASSSKRRQKKGIKQNKICRTLVSLSLFVFRFPCALEHLFLCHYYDSYVCPFLFLLPLHQRISLFYAVVFLLLFLFVIFFSLNSSFIVIWKTLTLNGVYV